jgi:ATP-dependent Clp protease ATP-binding subunit ClpA
MPLHDCNDANWSARHITDSAQCILEQIPGRASDRGLHLPDRSSIVTLALWSLLLWERKVGLVALEHMGGDRFDLARAVDRLLVEKAREHPVAYDSHSQQAVLVKTGEPYKGWDFHALLEPLLEQAEHEALEMGHNYVGSEHLLLAIVHLADSALSAVLRERSLDHGRVRQAIQYVLRGRHPV